MELVINDRAWQILFVSPYDRELLSSNNIYVLGVTNNTDSSIYINK